MKSRLTEIPAPQFRRRINEREKPATGPGLIPEGIRDRWTWVEPTVWTDRMLTALEEGVKGGRWYCLWDKVLKPENAHASFAKVKARRGSPGVDHVTVEMFETRLEDNLDHVIRQLREGKYVPSAVKRVEIPKPGSREKRPLGIPTVRERVVQGMLKQVLEPIFERHFTEHSYGFRPGRGCKDALRRVQALLHAGYTWVVDADIKRYFDSIPHEPLLERVGERVTDGKVLDLIEKFLKQGILDGLGHWTPEEGTPQGAVLTLPTILTTFVKSWRLPYHGHVCGLAVARGLGRRQEERQVFQGERLSRKRGRLAMAGKRKNVREGVRVERIHERSRVERVVLASVYELLAPTQRWGLHSDCRAASMRIGTLADVVSVQRLASGEQGYG